MIIFFLPWKHEIIYGQVDPTAYFYTAPDESNPPILPPFFLKPLSTHRSSYRTFPYVPVLATNSAKLSVSYLIVRSIFDEKDRLWNFSLRSFLNTSLEDKLFRFFQSPCCSKPQIQGGILKFSSSGFCSIYQNLVFQGWIVSVLTLRWLMSYIYGAPILDVSRSHTTTQHSR